MMHALITNDDGIDSAGLVALAAAAVRAGLDVTVAAPHEESSGTSASLSALESGNELRYTERVLPDLVGVPAYAAVASPAMIAFVGTRGAFGTQPDVVLSGINNGPNTGHAVLHSGTVGAALTAASHGAAALAISLATSRAQHWPTAAAAADRVVAWFANHAQPGRVLNVNVPDIPLEQWRGFRPARLAPFGAVQAEVGERGHERVIVTLAEPADVPQPGTDVAALRDGWASLTALVAPCETALPDLSDPV